MLKQLIKKLKKTLISDVVFQVNPVQENQSYLLENEFNYILNLYELYKSTQNIPGHIVEIGVAHGRNAIIFGNLIKNFGEKSTKKYHGLDTFDGYSEIDILNERHLDKHKWKNIEYQSIKEKINSLGLSDISKIYKINAYDIQDEFLNKGGFQFQPNSLLISLLYIDCNSYGAALHAMESCLPYISKGGLIAIDEKNLGGETKALVEFSQKYNLRLEKRTFPQVYSFIKIT